MSLVLNAKKPTISLSSTPLCSFRSSKAYLWGLIRDRLSFLQNSSSDPLEILDAACHVLLTRPMFPPSSQYYGLDISRSRLTTAFAKKLPSDVLLLADLCRDISVKHCFDCVVSCNTLSHLPFDQQIFALNSLIDFLKPSGSLFVNISLSAYTSSFTKTLLKQFESVEVVYFDSLYSQNVEDTGVININNVYDFVIKNEIKLPNDASLHSQILYLCTNYQGTDKCVKSAFSPAVINQLNHVPLVKITRLKDDSSLLTENFFEYPSLILFTSKLYHSDYGKSLVSQLVSINFTPSILDDSIDVSTLPDFIYILGLEEQWVSSVHDDRIRVNRLREQSGITINFLIVSSRNSSTCTPSLIVTDV